jgi:hypothetical protein
MIMNQQQTKSGDRTETMSGQEKSRPPKVLVALKFRAQQSEQLYERKRDPVARIFGDEKCEASEFC